MDWDSDRLVNPPVRTTSTSGPVAGQATVHIRLQTPPNAYGVTLKKLRIHEQAGHLPDPSGCGDDVTIAMSPTGAHMQRGDPPNGTPGNFYLDINWSTFAGHNGLHDIIVKAQYTILIYNPPSTQTVTTGEHQITVDVSNLIVQDDTPANPTPILWNPPNPQGVRLKCALQHAQRGTCTVTYEVLRPDQSLVISHEAADVERPGPHEWPWDGRLPSGEYAEKGVYLFRISARTVFADPESDSEKSTLLHIAPARDNNNNPLPIVRYGGLQGDNVVFFISYNLESEGLLADAHIDLYGPDTVHRGAFPLQAADVEAGYHRDVGGPNMPARIEVTKTDLAMRRTYTFLICIKDDDVAHDKGHRHRWALPLGGLYSYQPVHTTDPVGDGGSVPLFCGQTEGQGGQVEPPCPIVIKGTVAGTADAKPLLKYVFQDTILGEGVPLVLLEEISTDDLADEHVDWDGGASVWRYRVTWNQQLLRTNLLDPLDGSIEIYEVGALALCAPDQPDVMREFRVVSMARPASTAISSDFADWQHQRTGAVWIFATDSNGRRFTLPYISAGPHYAIDYGAGQNPNVVNAAEYGSVQEAEHQVERFQTWNNEAISQQAINNIETAVNQWLVNHGQPPMHLGPQHLGYPWNLFTLTYNQTGVDNTKILGPNREVYHEVINVLLLQDNTYDFGRVVSKYCHLDTPFLNPPNIGQLWNISEQIGVMGPTVPLRPEYINAIFQNGYDTPAKLLALGYFKLEGVTLTITPNGEPPLAPIGLGTVVFPSIDGPHLHFEVRMDGKEIPQEWNLYGSLNPHHWIGLSFGGWK